MNSSLHHDHYENPLLDRYASQEMSRIFSSNNKYRTWRRLWLFLAEAQKQAGLPIEQEQLNEMKQNLHSIDYEAVRKVESQLRHDVMAHLHIFAAKCPKAAPIIHLGATSAYLTDNTDLIQMKQALEWIHKQLLRVLHALRLFAKKYHKMPTVAYTHFQPAQLTTVGKRACLWMQDLILDIKEIQRLHQNMPFRGVKGATGTLASFKHLFKGNLQQIQQVSDYVRKKCGFKHELQITGQTYTRKIDSQVMSVLSQVAQSASKFAYDIRLLQHKGEVEEPFLADQVGSSAMAYKRNPVQAERIGSLGRFVMSLTVSTDYTASTQWFERTLDDSANKRLSIPQAFLATSGLLLLYENIAQHLQVYPHVIAKNVQEQMPFMITENIMMEGVLRKGNRQVLHEIIRRLSMKAVGQVKQGKPNNLLKMLQQTKELSFSKSKIKQLSNPHSYTGFSSHLTQHFLHTQVDQLLEKAPASTFAPFSDSSGGPPVPV